MKALQRQLRNLRSFMTFKSYWMLTLLIVLNGCGFGPTTATKAPLAPPPSLPSVTAPAVEAQKSAEESQKQASDIDGPLRDAESAAGGLPDSSARTAILKFIADARTRVAANVTAWANEVAQWNAMVERAKAQDAVVVAINKAMSDRDARIKQSEDAIAAANAKIAKLEAGDPVVTRLNYAGLACLVAAVAALGVGIWLNIVALRTLSFVLGGVGLAILTLARYLHTLEMIVGGLALVAIVGAIVYLIIHKKVSPAVASARAIIAGVAGDISSSATAPTQDTGAVAPAVGGK